MNIEQISQGLLAKFDNCRLVFWQDTDEEFTSQLEELSIDGIEVIRIDDFSHFQVKERIELLEPDTRFVLYSTKETSKPERDWLYDIRLYSENFYADSSSMILNELGMRMEFRPVVANYRAFFTNKSRVARLKKLLPHNANKEELELALIAATLKVESATFITILLDLLAKLSSDAEPQSLFKELEKYNLVDTFWHFASNTVGYNIEKADSEESQQQPDLADLAAKLLLTECYQSLINSGVSNTSDILVRFTQHLLPISLNEFGKRDNSERSGVNSSKRATAVSLIKNMRENRSMSAAYNKLAKEVEQEFELKQVLSMVKSPRHLQRVETFEYAEQQFIVLLAQQLNELEQVEVDALISHRLSTHWTYHQPNYSSILKAIRAAKHFYSLKHKYIDGFEYASAKDMYRAYENELYKFDSAYREFCEHSLKVAHNGSDILKMTGLVGDIETLYVDWYLHDLAIAWDKLVDDEKLLDKWKIPGVPNQYDFYRHQVEGLFNTSQVKKVFVIISDALRYDVAHAISDEINNEERFAAELKSQLGVVPSYTQLGMASLLPYNKLTAHIGSKVEYKADGISVHGTENRQKILAKRNGLAFKASEVLSWTNEEGRKKVHDARIVYIYHDRIDAIGDKAVTENQTFEACAETISEIKLLVERIINRLNGSRVLVTADHGFIFKSSDVVESDKTALTVKPKGAVEAKKRYIIGESLPSEDFYRQAKMAATANLTIDARQQGAENCSDAEFIVPRGSNRFNFVGGAKFIHGGIMPQEICVPVIQVKQLKTEKQQTKHAKERVPVVPLSNPIRLVSLADKIELFQAGAVGNKYMARELEIWIEAPNGQVVSHKQKMLFDATSERQEDRKRSVVIMLSGSGFGRTISYKLMMRDVTQPNKTIDLQPHSVTIDIAIEDDFF
ncbi:BREX-1 system phosphatase PglZ type A [Vibrio anguillarum]|uniref:BREX-1 system phosphatase PglZ type A n=1 Tax=Vibrio anguillarum TaxID=55601 RepID=UPI001C04ACF4|nr:BREX-1 system phosphatase PglZ type A [Vibrio anguillarum]MBT2926805.1 BREX-1 system phosphatase PglZ type A [Vibrio anguillarum]